MEVPETMDPYKNERQGNFRFSKEELDHKSLTKAVSDKCYEILLYDLRKAGIIIHSESEV